MKCRVARARENSHFPLFAFICFIRSLFQIGWSWSPPKSWWKNFNLDIAIHMHKRNAWKLDFVPHTFLYSFDLTVGCCVTSNSLLWSKFFLLKLFGLPCPHNEWHVESKLKITMKLFLSFYLFLYYNMYILRMLVLTRTINVFLLRCK